MSFRHQILQASKTFGQNRIHKFIFFNVSLSFWSLVYRGCNVRGVCKNHNVLSYNHPSYVQLEHEMMSTMNMQPLLSLLFKKKPILHELKHQNKLKTLLCLLLEINPMPLHEMQFSKKLKTIDWPISQNEHFGKLQYLGWFGKLNCIFLSPGLDTTVTVCFMQCLQYGHAILGWGTVDPYMQLLHYEPTSYFYSSWVATLNITLAVLSV